MHGEFKIRSGSRESVASANGNGGVLPLPDITKLSSSFDEQRGDAVRPDFLIELRCALWVTLWQPQSKRTAQLAYGHHGFFAWAACGS